MLRRAFCEEGDFFDHVINDLFWRKIFFVPEGREEALKMEGAQEQRPVAPRTHARQHSTMSDRVVKPTAPRPAPDT